jgi:hypothetical protein
MQRDPMTAYPGLSKEDAPDIRGARLYSPPRHHAIWQEYHANGKSVFGESLMVG